MPTASSRILAVTALAAPPGAARQMPPRELVGMMALKRSVAQGLSLNNAP
jgi:hypothetical protein